MKIPLLIFVILIVGCATTDIDSNPDNRAGAPTNIQISNMPENIMLPEERQGETPEYPKNEKNSDKQLAEEKSQKSSEYKEEPEEKPIGTVFDAEFIRSDVPRNMESGRTYKFSVHMRNNGTVEWSEPVRLGLFNSQNSIWTWGYGRAKLQEDVVPGKMTEFEVRVIAPREGTYEMQWRMLEEGVAWFGETTDTFKITVDEKIILDPRLGVIHYAGMYPDYGEQYFVKSAQDAYQLGFRSIELNLGRTICLETEKFPRGYYHTTDWCKSHAQTKAESITELMQHPRYQQVFRMPFETYFFTYAATTNLSGANHWTMSFKEYTPEQLDVLYDEVYEWSQYVLKQFAGSDKTFILQSPNEIDWSLIANQNLTTEEKRWAAPSQLAIENGRAFWNTIQQAVDDAKSSLDYTGVELYHGCEINHVTKTLFNGTPGALTEVVPYTNCDLYGFSAWQSALHGDPNTFSDSLALIKEYAPDSKSFGENNVYLSELGVPSRERGEAESAELLKLKIEESFAAGAPYINYWALYGTACDKFGTPEDDDCRGFWIRKPSGQLAQSYTTFLEFTQ